MGFLTPLFLAAAAAVAVPVLLHLLHLRAGKRQPFPALRYLRRTEKEHARRIRLRQILLLLLRAAAVLVLVAAGARLFIEGQGGDHDPTALAIVLDNSMSSGAVIGDERVLDRLKRRALESVAAASPEDRIWVVRAGAPWEILLPVSPEQARQRVLETEPGGAELDLGSTVARARSLVAAAGMPASEVHLFSDLQASALPAGSRAEDPVAEVPVLVLETAEAAPRNRYVSDLVVGGGFPPVVDETTEIAVEVHVSGEGRSRTAEEEGEERAGADENEDLVRVRLVIDERMTAAADAPLGSTVLLPAGPFPLEEVTGSVEIDPDALRVDDRRYFSFRVRPPSRVGVAGDAGLFLTEALAVLAEESRVFLVPPAEAEVLVSTAGEGLDSAGADVPVIVFPSEDPALLAATNRRLRESGIPWSLELEGATGEVTLEPVDLPVSLERVRVRRSHRLIGAEGGASSEVRVRTGAGQPWMISGTSASGRSYVLVASPLSSDATSLPVSPEMLPVVEWLVSGWPPTYQTRSSSTVGEPLQVPEGATTVRTPDGTVHPVDGRQPFQATGSAGIYFISSGDSLIARRAVNLPAGESLLDRLDPGEVTRRIPPPVRMIPESDSWSSRIFLERRGREPWRLLLLAVFLLLVAESLAAAGGGRPRGAVRSAARGASSSPPGEGAEGGRGDERTEGRGDGRTEEGRSLSV